MFQFFVEVLTRASHYDSYNVPVFLIDTICYFVICSVVVHIKTNELYRLWDGDGDAADTANVRYAYMDAITMLVREAFSNQIGSWCHEHGVMYIGHVVEDCNAHARTANSLGHYFRCMAGQDMAGIDIIGPQVLPQCEDGPTRAWEP